MKIPLELRPSIHLCGGLGSRICFVALVVFGNILRPPKFRGIGTLSALFKRIGIGGQRDIVLSLWQNRKIAIGTADYYWSRLIFNDFEYEPEIEFVLSNLLTPETIFLDLGANIGYWSIFCSTIIPAMDRIVAVEAGGDTYSRLENNRALNHSVFTALNRAVSETSQEVVLFPTKQKHASAQIATGTIETTTIPVETISIDDLLHIDTSYTGLEPVIVKLDVEGAEIPAMKGAINLLNKKNFLIAYEDHGNDPQSKISQFFFGCPGICIFWVSDGYVEQIMALDGIREKKISSKIGYNFFACHRESNFYVELGRLSFEDA